MKRRTPWEARRVARRRETLPGRRGHRCRALGPDRRQAGLRGSMESIKLFSNLKQKCGLGTKKTPLLDTRTLAGSARRCRRRLGPRGCCTEGWEVFLHRWSCCRCSQGSSRAKITDPSLRCKGKSCTAPIFLMILAGSSGGREGGTPEVPNPALSKPAHLPKNDNQDPKLRFVLQTYLCLLWSGFLLITGD